MVTGAPDERLIAPGAAVRIEVAYHTTAPCNDGLTGLGLRMHWDSRRLELTGVQTIFASGLVGAAAPAMDGADADQDPATDQFLLLAWADIDAAWPGGGCAPRPLFNADFVALGDQAGATEVRFSASSTAAGYGLDAPAVL